MTTPLTVVPAASAGVVLATAACAAGGDSFPNTGKEVAFFTNASVADIDVTIATPAEIDARAIASRVVTIAAGETKGIGPLDPGTYNNASGFVAMTYETETDLSVFVLQVTPA